MSTLTTTQLHFFDKIIDTANHLGAEVFVVGGCVRDIILGKNTADIDLIPLHVDYEVYARALAKNIKAFAIPFKDNIRLAKNDIIIDVSKPRGDTIYADLMLRDFTINNLALDMQGNIVGDKGDIDSGIIKAVYANTFVDDALRILRAFRFASQLGFTITDDTLTLALASAPQLSNIASERILEELRKTIAGKHFINVLQNSAWRELLLNNLEISLDKETTARLKQYEHVLSDDLFAAIVACSNKPEKMLDILKPSNNDIKLVQLIQKAEKDMLNSNLNNERNMKVFAWKYHNKIETITACFMSKYVEKMATFEQVLNASKTLDIDNAKNISGELLIKQGFKPSPIFKTILEDITLKLALNELTKDDIINYINDNYKGNN